MFAGARVEFARHAGPILAVAVAMTAAEGCAGKAVVSAPTGPPELLVRGHGPLEPMDRERYEREIRELGPRNTVVPVREWPAELPADAPVFLTELAGPRVTLAIRGDAASGFALLADRDANGKLDEPGIPFKKNDDGWAVTFEVAPLPAWTGKEARAPSVIEAEWQKVSFRPEGEKVWRLMICRMNVRRGVVELAGRKTAFAITGETGAYGRGPLEIFFDLNRDDDIEFDQPYSPERFTMTEERVVVGHTAYRFAVDPRGEAITLTRLPGKSEPRTNLELGARAPEFTLTDLDDRPRRLSDFEGSVVLLDFWSTGCAPCIWEMPSLAALRNKYRDRRFEILGVHVGPNVPEIATICDAKGAEWPQLIDGKNEVAGRYRVDRYPMTFLLDRNGRIINHGARGEELEAAVKAAVDR
jgi:thiol-disulfide isomerase/thioredoxin